MSEGDRSACLAFFETRQKARRGGHPCLVHRDYRPGNLPVDPQTFRITGLLDFEAVQVGDAGVDFAKVEGEFFRLRPEAREPFMAGYASVRPLPDPAEVAVHDLINTLGSIHWAAEHASPEFSAQNLARVRWLLSRE